MKLTILFLFITSFCFAQNEYVQVYTTTIGTGGKDNADFYFSDNDSAKVYRQMRIPHIINAISLLESKGWELVTITTTSSGMNMITVAYLRRKK